MADISIDYYRFVEAEAAAQLGQVPLSEARKARSAYAEAAKALVADLSFKTKVAVREGVTRRVDAAEHVAAAKDVEVGPFSRQAGEALCDRAVKIGETAVEVKRRAPSCLRCLTVAEKLAYPPA